jgi:hypothetical protein
MARVELRDPRLLTQSAIDRGERCVNVAGPHFLRHVVSPLQDNNLTHDDGQIAIIDFTVG